MADAAAEREVNYTTEKALYDGKTRSEVIDIVDNLLDQSLEKCNDPMIHKVMALQILSNMVEWHTKQGLELFQEGETEAGVAWTRDGGKFQAAMGIILSIGVGPNDWTLPNN